MQTRKRIHSYKNACQKKDDELLANIHAQRPEPNKLLKEINSHWVYEDLIYRFYHAKFFLEMAVRYGKGLKTAPAILPSGWAALLCLYNLR